MKVTPTSAIPKSFAQFRTNGCSDCPPHSPNGAFASVLKRGGGPPSFTHAYRTGHVSSSVEPRIERENRCPKLRRRKDFRRAELLVSAITAELVPTALCKIDVDRSCRSVTFR